MADPLDMTLDDLIKRNKKLKGENVNYRGEGSGRGRAYSSGHRPSRPLPDGGRFRAAPFSINLPGIKKRERPTEEEASDNKAGTKLYVSNLNFGVSHEDIKVLFSDVGELKRYAIHYDKNGRPKGTAEVVYTQHSDALTAIKRFSHVHLDGRPLKLELVGVDVVRSSAIPQATYGISFPPLATDGILGDGWAFRRNGPKQGRERGQASRGKRDGREEVSAEALDADLEQYRQGATLLSNF